MSLTLKSSTHLLHQPCVGALCSHMADSDCAQGHMTPHFSAHVKPVTKAQNTKGCSNFGRICNIYIYGYDKLMFEKIHFQSL